MQTNKVLLLRKMIKARMYNAMAHCWLGRRAAGVSLMFEGCQGHLLLVAGPQSLAA